MARTLGKTAAAAMTGIDPASVKAIETLHRKVQWLSAWTIHNANHIRPSRDGLKVGGHQASSASLAAVMSALYFSVLTPRDRVAVKPHASPSFHAIQYLLGNQTLDQLQKFRGLGGAQSYPSRTKDKDDVDFSTGSVGLGVAVTAFASITQDYLVQKNMMPEADMGRMIALMGDAELDEGNIYEALIEGYKHDLRNCWWIIDYNRQSLDATTSDRMFDRFRDIFATVGWEVINLKYGKKQQAAFERPGGGALRDWIDACQNSLYSALIYKGGAAWRTQLMVDIGHKPGIKKLLASYDDEGLGDLMANLGGHDIELILETFHAVKSDKPHCFIAYTVKGWGLPFQGHKDNHSGLMNPAQMADYQKKMGVPEGQEWAPFAGLEDQCGELQAFLDAVPFNQTRNRRYEAPSYSVPAPFPLPVGDHQATQVAFGKIMNELAKGDSEMAGRIVTTSPDVTVSTNLGGWVNQRGIFNRLPRADVFKEQNVVSPQKWAMTESGQHIELGIAESNLFLLLASLGLSSSLFGQRLLPVGTLYDPFICRGLDQLIYACYQEARFMVVSTPSGITLAPEGGAHQSFNTPLIGMAQDNLVYYEPAYVDELSIIMAHGFDYMQRPDGGSVYLRLSTRSIEQPKRTVTAEWQSNVLRGAYWVQPPAADCPIVIAYSGVLAPEANAAFEQLREDVPGAGLLAITSADRLHAEWNASVRALGRDGIRKDAHIENLLSALKPGAAIVTVMDAAPNTLSWLGSVCGNRVIPLGVDRFGQTADIDDLYQVYRIGKDAILDACASAFVKG